MTGTVAVILGTVILTGTIFIVSLTSSDAQSDNVTIQEIQDTTVSGYSVNITSILEEAGDNINDEDIAAYYRQLCDRYDLDDEISLLALQEESTEADVIPIEDINRTALLSMLEQAGSTIRDEELAEFYYQFLDKAGWEIEPEE